MSAELKCGAGGACVWRVRNGQTSCDRCCRSYEDRFEDTIAYEETKARVVAAARRVVEALAEVREEAQKEDPEDIGYLEAQDARDEAIDTLAAELAKLEGGA